MKTALVYFSIYFAFYILGAYATTDILRLLKGSTLYVNERPESSVFLFKKQRKMQTLRQ